MELTKRKVEALVAVLYGQSYWMKHSFTRPDGTMVWRSSRSGGGAVHRMGEELIEAGLIQNHSASYRIGEELGLRPREVQQLELPEVLKADKGGLTVKGLQALDAELRKGRKYDPTDTRLGMIKDQLPKRTEVEAAYEAFVTARRDATKAAWNRKRAAQAEALVADTRAALTAAGGGLFQQGLDDDAVRRLVRSINEAQHGLGYVRYLDDADLSRELDEAEKTATTPGTLGDDQRSEKIAAIRAEFKRRAEAEL